MKYGYIFRTAALNGAICRTATPCFEAEMFVVEDIQHQFRRMEHDPKLIMVNVILRSLRAK